jgi:hypothetical protein
MNLRLFAIILTCTAAPAIAFPLGVRVGSGWHDKFGVERPDSGGALRAAAHLHPVHVIIPGTLDGQSIPGNGGRSSGHGRELSPVYPTSASLDRDISVSQGLAPAAAGSPETADPSGSSQISAEPRPLEHHIKRFGKRMDVAIMADRHGRRLVSMHRRQAHRVTRTAGAANPSAIFAGLLFQ